MSVADVASRIQQIQGQIALLSPSTTANPASSAAFASALAGATGAAGGRHRGDGPRTVRPPPPRPAPSTGGQAVVDEAEKYLGVPYVWGGTNPATGLDCSGLVQHVYEKFGVDLPRVSYQQATAGTPVAEPRRGPARRHPGLRQPGAPRRDLHRRRQDDRGAAARQERPGLPGLRDPHAHPPGAPARPRSRRRPGSPAPGTVAGCHAVRLAVLRRRPEVRRPGHPARRGGAPGVRLRRRRHQPGRCAGPDAADARDRPRPRREPARPGPGGRRRGPAAARPDRRVRHASTRRSPPTTPDRAPCTATTASRPTPRPAATSPRSSPTRRSWRTHDDHLARAGPGRTGPGQHARTGRSARQRGGRPLRAARRPAPGRRRPPPAEPRRRPGGHRHAAVPAPPTGLAGTRRPVPVIVTGDRATVDPVEEDASDAAADTDGSTPTAPDATAPGGLAALTGFPVVALPVLSQTATPTQGGHDEPAGSRSEASDTVDASEPTGADLRLRGPDGPGRPHGSGDRSGHRHPRPPPRPVDPSAAAAPAVHDRGLRGGPHPGGRVHHRRWRDRDPDLPGRGHPLRGPRPGAPGRSRAWCSAATAPPASPSSCTRPTSARCTSP